MNKFNSKNGLILVSLITTFILAGTAYYFYNKYTHTQAILQNPTIATKEEIKSITSKLSKMIELPKDEEPTIATVLDKSKLKDQPFFKKAENGDKVIMYVKSLKAILYRPSTNKVIDFSIITMSPQPIQVVLYNGTDTSGLTEKVQKDFEQNISGLTIASRDNAIENYEKTLVIDLSGVHANEAKQLANIMKGEVGKLPKEEKTPVLKDNLKVDILIIVGKNYLSPSSKAE